MRHSVVIVDDHVLIAKALRVLIESFSGYDVLYETENGKGVLEMFKHTINIPDIVLLDINMPVMDGFETASWLKEFHPDVRILALSMQDDDRTLIKMVRRGARGYLLKDIKAEELQLALRSVMERDYYYSEWFASKMRQNLSDSSDGAHQIKIAERELEFLKLASTELTYKEIAGIMECSPRTVDGYRDSLFEKLNVRSRVGLALYAVKNQVVIL